MAAAPATTEPATTLRLHGEVCAGQGEGAGFLQLEWVRREFAAKLGFEPYPGTFNLHMAGADWDAARARIAHEPGITIDPEPGFCAARCFRVVLDGRVTGAAVLPEVPGYPADKLEIVSAVPVRRTLGVADGDRIAVHLVC
jgi:CTP-dependent riboflavin kinase